VLGVPPQKVGTEQASFKGCFFLLPQVLYRLSPLQQIVPPSQRTDNSCEVDSNTLAVNHEDKVRVEKKSSFAAEEDEAAADEEVELAEAEEERLRRTRRELRAEKRR
jgi:hypothetical protein